MSNQQERLHGNNNNFATPTNFICGSSKLNLVQVYCQSINIPGISLNHAYLGTGFGTPTNVSGDNIIYNPLSITLAVDENFESYFEFMTKLNQNVHPNSGSFADIEFDFFISVNNTKGNEIFKIDFSECRVSSISDIMLNTTEDETMLTVQIDLLYDYYTITKNGNTIPILRT